MQPVPTISAAPTISVDTSLPVLTKSRGHQSDPELSSSSDEEKGTTAPNAPPEFVRSITGFKWVLVCAGFYFSAFLYGLDNTITADIQTAVIESFGDISKLSWLGTGFPLGSIATILTL